MKAALCVLVLAVAFAPLTIVRAQSSVDAAMMQPVQQWIDAYNAGTAPLPEDRFTDDAVITDEFPPFVWSGKAGEHQWANAIDKFIRPGNQHVSVGAAQSVQVARDGSRVAFALPATLTLTSTRTGQRTTEHALWRFVLVRSLGGRWMIAADTWTQDATPQTAVSVPLIQEHGVLLLAATLDGAGPLLFTFDPGAGDVYTRYAREQLHGRTPQTVCLSAACYAADMQYFDGDPSAIFPKHDAANGTIAGSIGPKLLAHYAARIDYHSSTLTLIPLVRFQPPAGAHALVMHVDAAGLPAVGAAVDGKNAAFELDMRAPTSMLFRPFLAGTGLGDSYARTPVVKQSGTLLAHAIDTVQVGGAALHRIAFWFSTDTSGKFANADVAGLLGNNVLSNFVVTLDVPHHVVYLTAS